MKSLWTTIKNLEEDDELKVILSTNDEFFKNIELFFDQISLSDFSFN
jgi:hypothetical protein